MNAATVVSLYEAIYFFQKYKRSAIETEQLKKEMVQSQLETLKSQVNPHFLFNSLNTLVSVIPEDPDKAVDFVDRIILVDLAYTTPDDVTLLATYNDELYRWTYDATVREWTTHEAITTEMVGVFRTVQAGEDMYLIDEDGDVFAAPDEGHARLGRIAGFNDIAGSTLLLFEDHTREKVGAVRVADGEPTPLHFTGDADFASDFITEITDTQVRDALNTMAGLIDNPE